MHPHQPAGSAHDTVGPGRGPAEYGGLTGYAELLYPSDGTETLLDLCFTLLDHAHIMPYYFYMCDMIPSSEHWRLAVHEAQRLQHDLMGYLPGFATPRIVCDVPLVGKRWVNQLTDYDREKGISYWTKNYRTALEADDAGALTRRYEYYDPIYTLPESGQAHWRAFRARA